MVFLIFAACHLLGDYLEAIKKDFERAGKVYRSNCDDYKFPKSCHKFANYLLLGRGCKRDEKSGFTYYDKACGLGYSDSCFNLGLICTSKTFETAQPQNYVLGLKYLDKACTMGHAGACYHAGALHILGTMDKTVPQDMKKAFEYSVKGCDLGNMYACANVSQMYLKGEGVEKDEKKAQEYKAKALDFQDQSKHQFQIEFQQGLQDK